MIVCQSTLKNSHVFGLPEYKTLWTLTIVAIEMHSIIVVIRGVIIWNCEHRYKPCPIHIDADLFLRKKFLVSLILRG